MPAFWYADMTEKQQLFRNIVLTFLAQLLLLLRGLLVMPIIVKMAGVDVFGAYVILGSFITFVYAVSALGTNYTYRRQLPSTNSLSQRRALMMPQLAFRLITVLGLCIAFLMADQQLSSLLHLSEDQFDFRLGCLWLLGLLVNEQVTDYYRYVDRIGAFNLVTIVPLFAFIGAVIVVALLKVPITLNLLALLQASALLLINAPIFFLDILGRTGIEWPRTNWNIFFNNAKTGFPLIWGFISDFLLNVGDRYLILLFLSMSAVGEYQTAYQLAALLAFFPQIISVVLPTQMSRLWDQGNRIEAEYLVKLCLHMFLMIAIPFVVGALLTGPSVLALLANAKCATAARWVVPLVASGMVFYGVVLLFQQIGFVTGHNARIQGVNAIALIANFGLNATILPFLPDITVAGATTLVAYLLAATMSIRVMLPVWRIPVDWGRLMRYVVATGIMAALLLVLGYRPGLVQEVSVLRLVCDVVGAMTSYFVGLMLVGGFSRKDLGLLVNLIRKRKFVESSSEISENQHLQGHARPQ